MNVPKLRYYTKKVHSRNTNTTIISSSDSGSSKKGYCDIALFWNMKVKTYLIDPNYNYNQDQNHTRTNIIRNNHNNNNNNNNNNNSNNIHNIHDVHVHPRGLSINEMKLMLMERPSLGKVTYRRRLFTCIEKKDLVEMVLDSMPTHLGERGEDYNKKVNDDNDGDNDNDNDDDDDDSEVIDKDEQTSSVLKGGFNHLWFGSYASSIIDSKRVQMTIDELVSLNGFSMNFKVVTTTVLSSSSSSSTAATPTPTTPSMATSQPYREDIQLHFHGMCYFDENFGFHLEQDEDDNAREATNRQSQHPHQQQHHFHQNILTWKWIRDGRILQIERYPPLFISR